MGCTRKAASWAYAGAPASRLAPYPLRPIAHPRPCTPAACRAAGVARSAPRRHRAPGLVARCQELQSRLVPCCRAVSRDVTWRVPWWQVRARWRGLLFLLLHVRVPQEDVDAQGFLPPPPLAPPSRLACGPALAVTASRSLAIVFTRWVELAKR